MRSVQANPLNKMIMYGCIVLTHQKKNLLLKREAFSVFLHLYEAIDR